LDVLDEIVTDDGISEEWVQRMEQSGIRMEVAGVERGSRRPSAALG
jgi:hypothetical protein